MQAGRKEGSEETGGLTVRTKERSTIRGRSFRPPYPDLSHDWPVLSCVRLCVARSPITRKLIDTVDERVAILSQPRGTDTSKPLK